LYRLYSSAIDSTELMFQMSAPSTTALASGEAKM
jgi:hypothetical protein